MTISFMHQIDSPNTLICSFLALFYSFLMLVIFLKNIFLCDNLTPPLNELFSISCHNFGISVFPNIFNSLLKNWFVHKIENNLLKIVLVFCSKFCVHINVWLQLCFFCLNSITLWNFSTASPWSSGCFKALISMA